MTVLVVLAALIAIGFLGIAFLITFLFWYERVNAPCARLKAPEPGVIPCVRMFLRTVGGYATGMVYHPRGWISLLFCRRKPLPPGPSALPPILLVHGIYHNASCWAYHRKRLERQGYPVLVYAYHSFGVPLETILDDLDTAITTLEKTYPGNRPLLIGHSLGGVLLRLWLDRAADNAERARGLITLGTPHRGSRLASLALGRLVRVLRPGSAVLDTLNGRPADDRIACVAVVSDTDEMVLPSDNLLPPENWALRLWPGVSHFGFLVGRSQFRRLCAEIQAFHTEPPGTPK